ncbi:hypothetical protein JOF28_002156 [Leucobacter exalbidus]|uniref:DUF4287 domain-containing protein n=1 Tax=Leucobacter exalbidus TaxID=662960 RepID=A0A940T4K7_9MICO|nr:hypothetical protein [Leucobacter exalbidus]MBP1326924.1 hypothetical protein [Leucobacter exalbidus]
MTASTPARSAASTGTRAESIPAIERMSGRDWASWLELFAAAEALTAGHTQIARIARAALPDSVQNPDWWAQAVAIAFEQHSGLRVPGQGSDGLFRVSASRTLPLDRDAAIAAWVAAHGAAAQQLDHAVLNPRQSRTDKRSFWRFDLENGGRVEVSATPKGDDKVTLAVSHDGLPTGEAIEGWRAHWKALLAQL